jgi:hypothetical protein
MLNKAKDQSKMGKHETHREAANTNVIVFSLDPTVVRTHDILKYLVLINIIINSEKILGSSLDRAYKLLIWQAKLNV